jgi:hypothetical protein
MVSYDQRTAAKETNEKSETGEWRVPAQQVKAAPSQQCIGWNEYRQRDCEPGSDCRHKRAQEIKLGLHLTDPARSCERAGDRNQGWRIQR